MGFQEYVDRFLGEEGIKTDVQVSLKKDTYVTLGVVIVLSILIGSGLAGLAKKLL